MKTTWRLMDAVASGVGMEARGMCKVPEGGDQALWQGAKEDLCVRVPRTRVEVGRVRVQQPTYTLPSFQITPPAAEIPVPFNTDPFIPLPVTGRDASGPTLYPNSHSHRNAHEFGVAE